MANAPSFGAVALERAENAQKYFLRQILSFRVLAGETVAEAVDPARVRAHQRLPGGLFPVEAPFDKVEIGIQSILQRRLRRRAACGFTRIVPMRVVRQWRSQWMCNRTAAMPLLVPPSSMDNEDL